MDASKMGFRIIPNNLGKSLFKNNDFSLVTYQLKNKTNLKEAHFIRDKSDLILYSPLKLKYSDEYDDIKIRLKELSTSVEEIIFSKTQISFLWKEKIGLDELKEIFDVINSF
jgi:poly-D-alanine transfer protein DltD